MQIITIFIVVFVSGKLLAAEDESFPVDFERQPVLVRDELEAISCMISQQKRKLTSLIELKRQISHFTLLKKQFSEGSQSQKLALEMVLAAKDLLVEINKEHIAHLFSEEFLKDLVFFSSIADKSRVGPP